MKITTIAGQKFVFSPPEPFAQLVDYLVSVYPAIEVEQRKHDDPDLASVSCDLLVGHSFGAFEALRLFNNNVGTGCLCLDYVNEDSAWARLLLVWPTAARAGVKSLHRNVKLSQFTVRSTGVKSANDEILEIDHGAFPNHQRTSDLIVRWIKTLTWS